MKKFISIPSFIGVILATIISVIFGEQSFWGLLSDGVLTYVLACVIINVHAEDVQLVLDKIDMPIFLGVVLGTLLGLIAHIISGTALPVYTYIIGSVIFYFVYLGLEYLAKNGGIKGLLRKKKLDTED